MFHEEGKTLWRGKTAEDAFLGKKASSNEPIFARFSPIKFTMLMLTLNWFIGVGDSLRC